MESTERCTANQSIDDREERLGELISDWLERLEKGETPDRRKWLALHPEFAAELEEFLAQEDRMRVIASPLREAALAVLVDTPAFLETTAITDYRGNHSQPAANTFSNLELLEEIGRGGMAIVYRALQKDLGRLVALKLFRSDHLGRADDLNRFRREAEIVAQLDHPSIIPVYEVGEQSGHIYYTMKLIEGGNLHSQLSQFQNKPRSAARLMIAIARAVHYAHQRGILHRDLKPSNILLTEEKETDAASLEYAPHVSDFGLAKRIGKDAGLTHTGAVVGTPAYMAPEQATGETNAVTTATDVYGLGTILYAVLTGKPPFHGESVLDTLAMVKESEPEPPRRSNPKIPRDLETICLKCIRKEPQRRYDSAAAFADDLGRWLRNEPIVARSVGRVERVWQWCRRQPMQAALGSSLIVALIAGFALVFWQWRRAENNLETTEMLRNEAIEREAEIDESFRLAHNAVRDTTGLLESSGQLEAHGMDPLRRELLEKTQTYYKKFLERRGHDPSLRVELAQASATLADIVRQIGTPDEALEAYKQAVTNCQALLAADPNNVNFNRQFAIILNQYASVYATLGQRDKAIARFNEAKTTLENSLVVHPADAALRSELSATKHNLGRCELAAGRFQAAMAAFAESRSIDEKLLGDEPNNLEYQRRLAITLNSIGTTLNDANRSREAMPLLKKAVSLSDSVARRLPEKRALQFALAEHLGNLGECQFRCKERKLALESLSRSRGILLVLTRGSPHVTEYQKALGVCCAVTGRAQMEFNDPGSAFESFESARAIFRQLMIDHPRVPDFARNFTQVLLDLAKSYSHMKRYDNALEIYQEASGIALNLAESFPDDPDDASRLALCFQDKAMTLKETGRFDEVRDAVLQAVEWQKRALAKAKSNPIFRHRLTSHYATLAAANRVTGRIGEAVEAAKKRLELWPNNAEEQYFAAVDLALSAAAVKNDLDSRQTCEDLAMDALHQAIKSGFRDADKISKDARLESLRSRRDYQRLLNEVAAPKK